MAVFMTVLLTISTVLTAPKADAAGKKISLPIYNSCGIQPLSLFASEDKQYCILAKNSRQKLKRTSDNTTPEKVLATKKIQQPSSASVQSPSSTAAQQSNLPASAAVQPVSAEPNLSSSDSGQELNADVLFTLVNNIRVQHGLTPFEKDESLCGIANSRAPELYNEIFGSSYMHAGFQSRNLPYWATENMIHMNTEEQAVNWWMNSPIHRSAILGDYKFSCTACAGKSCCQLFTSYLPK